MYYLAMVLDKNATEDILDELRKHGVKPEYAKIRDEIPKERRKELVKKWFSWYWLAGQEPQPYPVWENILELKSYNTAELVYFGSYVSGVFMSDTHGEKIEPEVFQETIKKMWALIDEGLD